MAGCASIHILFGSGLNLLTSLPFSVLGAFDCLEQRNSMKGKRLGVVRILPPGLSTFANTFKYEKKRGKHHITEIFMKNFKFLLWEI